MRFKFINKKIFAWTPWSAPLSGGKLDYWQVGFAALFVTILVLVAMLGIGVSLTILTLGEHKISRNIIKSSQAYYAAEAGTEDGLIRLKDELNFSSPYSFKVGEATTTVEISDIIGGSRTITSTGNSLDRIRKIQVNYAVSSQQVSFYYGAQIGDGGMDMRNNSRVKGNVFSNGSVVNPAGTVYIEGSIVVAGNGNLIRKLNVGVNAKVFQCENSTIGGELTYVTGGDISTCTAGSTAVQSDEISAKDLPIAESQINTWQSEAETGGIIASDYVLDGGTTASLGPKKITGNMTIDNNSTLLITGTIWVQGDITVRNGSIIRLDPAFYGALSGLSIADGKIKIKPGVSLEGSGEEGSYILLISTNDSLDSAAPAIEIDNTTSGGVFYTPNSYAGGNGGLIVIRNNVEARQVTGYKIFLEQNAEIDYEYGLVDAQFSSGPGGSWEVVSWREIE